MSNTMDARQEFEAHELTRLRDVHPRERWGESVRSAVTALTGIADGVRSYLRRSSTATEPRRGASVAPVPSPSPDPIRLSDLAVGVTARLHDAQLDAESRAQLRALGLTDAARLRVCKQGEPCVVQVRTTRLGISSRIARHLFVIPCTDDNLRERSWR
jgi:Fe2+ transport system protein FeoA